MVRIILNLNGTVFAHSAVRAAQFLLDNPDKPDAILEYGDIARFWVKRGKDSIIVWEQTS